MNQLVHYLRAQAYNNAWANHRLLRACCGLTQAQFEARRTSFFPTIKATLNHILTCDWFYIDALERELRGDAPDPDCERVFAVEEPFATCAELRIEQQRCDRRLIAHCDAQDEATLERPVTILRQAAVQCDSRVRLLLHLFQHQIHHRGQVHAMLAGTRVAPPQLDEFFSSGEHQLRAADFIELGWDEDLVWRNAAH